MSIKLLIIFLSGSIFIILYDVMFHKNFVLIPNGNQHGTVDPFIVAGIKNFSLSDLITLTISLLICSLGVLRTRILPIVPLSNISSIIITTGSPVIGLSG